MTTTIPPAAPPPPSQPEGQGQPVALSIEHRPSYSRGLAALGCLLLYGRLIALLPVFVMLFFVGIAAVVSALVLQFAVLLTGGYPVNGHRFVTGYLRLSARASAFAFGLTDQYPGFTIQQSASSGTATAYQVQLSILHADSYSRPLALLGCIFFVGRFVALVPVLFVLYFLRIAAFVVAWVMQFVVLLTGTYPENAHAFVTGYLRLSARNSAWLFGLTDRYPRISLQA